jgi:hypothetical protein
MLAKYDFVSDYEAHEGAASEGSLYAGRGNYGDAVSMVLKNDPPGAGSEVGAFGGFKVVQSDAHQVVYGGDSDGICEYNRRMNAPCSFFLSLPVALLY